MSVVRTAVRVPVGCPSPVPQTMGRNLGGCPYCIHRDSCLDRTDGSGQLFVVVEDGLLQYI